MKKPLLTAFAALLAALSLLAPVPAAAQGVAPVLVVNGKPITQYELEQRALLLRAFGAGGDTMALAREALIDDRIKSAAAEEAGVELDADALDKGLKEFAASRELEVGQVMAALDQRGIDENTLLDFIEVGLTWRELVRSRFVSRARPSDQDLETALAFKNRDTQERVLLQELAIPVDPIGDTQTADFAEKLSRRLNRGGDFTAAVREYSRSQSARNDGRLDWMPVSELPPPVATQVLALMPGEVTAPIPLGPGLVIFKLRDIQVQQAPRPSAPANTLTWYELVTPLSAGASEAAVASAQSLARSVRRDTTVCADLDTRAAEFGGGGQSARTPESQVPARLAPRLAQMTPGDIDVFRDDRGVVLLMLCDRAGQTSPEEREEVRRRLFAQRLTSYSESYLQELRGDAVIVEK